MAQEEQILREDNFKDRYIQWFATHEDARSKLNERDIKLRDELRSFSYRILNSWEKGGLFDAERGAKGKGWRLFSFIDLVWLLLIRDLRNFGISLQDIQHIYQQLTFDAKKVSPSRMPLLEFFVAQYLSERQAIYLLIFSDFSVEFATQFDLDNTRNHKSLTNHISLSFHYVINEKKIERKLKEMKEMKEMKALMEH